MPRYQRQAPHDLSKKSYENQASILGPGTGRAKGNSLKPGEISSHRGLRDAMRAGLLPPASRSAQRSGYSKFFVPFVSFVVNFTGLA